MGKKSRRGGLAVAERPAAGDDVPVVGGREPCPCGSGKRYKLCHGRSSAGRRGAPGGAARSRGCPGECDWVAMREIVPSATAAVPVAEAFGGGEVTIVTVLPMAWPALHRADGTVFVALQTNGGSGDASRDVAAALLAAREVEPGNPVPERRPARGRSAAAGRARPATRSPVRVHEGFDFWLDGVGEVGAEVRGVDGAGERRRRPDRAADDRRGGLLVPRRRPRPPALGDARAGGRGARRAGPAARRRARRR